MNKSARAIVIGAGLAGCEAAWQLARRGVSVALFEMRPGERSPAHRTDAFAELVCSNSLRSDRVENAVGLLKAEMRRLSSLIMQAADHARVPAGGALAVDRDEFSGFITQALCEHPLIDVIRERVDALPPADAPCIVASGPLTGGALYKDIETLLPEGMLHFFDAAAPVALRDSLDMQIVFRASRYGCGDDYLNCPMDEAQYFAFYKALIGAQTAPVHDFEDSRVFEGCMPIETMAKRGPLTIAYGPLKPVGLTDPNTGRRPFAVVQLRQDDRAGSLYNLVGFQTRLKFGEQQRVFRMIPGLERAEFARYGVMHRNSFIRSPELLNADYSLRARPWLYFAGQITGVEGYVESAASGLVAGVSLARKLLGQAPVAFPRTTVIGAMARYVSGGSMGDFQPMNASFGLVAPPDAGPRLKKRMRAQAMAERALDQIDGIARALDQDDGAPLS